MKEQIVYRKEEVKSEAMKLLYSNLPKSIETFDGTDKWLPDFVEMVLCISEKASARMKSRSAVTYGTRTLPFDVNAYSEVSNPWSRIIFGKLT